MKNKALYLLKHPMVGSSSIVFLGTFGGNIINYLFNLVMGRLLSVQNYGLMVSLNTLLILISIFSVSFITIIAKFSARYHSTENKVGAHTLLLYSTRFISVFSIILFAILLIFVGPIASFIKVQNLNYILLVELAIFFSLIISLPLGFIQGTLHFKLLALVSVLQPLVRLIFAVLIIWAGFSIYGPLVGILLSALLPGVFLYIYLFRKYRVKTEDQKFDVKEFKKEFFHYTYTYFLSGIGITLLSNTDILLVRHFFTPDVAGQYAALSLMGKAILYFTSPISTVFFPIIAFKKERKERLFETVLLASVVIVGLSGVLSAVYFIIPGFVLHIFFPKPEYKVLAQYLGYFSLYILVFSFASLLNTYFLSIGRTKVYIITLFGALFQIITIILFHKSLSQVIAGLFIASLMMLLLLIIYYIKHGEDN